MPLHIPSQHIRPAIAALLTGIGLAGAHTDNFDDGDADGWLIADLSGDRGQSAAELSFPSGAALRQLVPPSPVNENGDPLRAFALCGAMTFTDFELKVDLVDWDDSRIQDVGLAARLSEPSSGQVNCYTMTFSADGSAIFIATTIDDQVVALVASESVDFVRGNHYQLVFRGQGDLLQGEAIALPGGETIATMSASDAALSEGMVGLVVNAFDSTQGIDVTFDNFFASDGDADDDGLPDTYEIDHFGDLDQSESTDFDADGQSDLSEHAAGTDPTDPLSVLRLLSLERDGDDLQFEIPTVEGITYQLQRSFDLKEWTAIDNPLFFVGDRAFTSVSIDQAGGYFRVVVP